MPSSATLQRTAAVECRALVKQFGETRAVDGVDVDVERGQVLGLVGPNGAGKTTLLRMLLGLARPDAGTIALLGRRLDTNDPRLPDGVAGFVEEPRFYPYLSVRANLELLVRLDGGGARPIDGALERAGLARIARQKAGGLSTGTRQRLGIAAALIREPLLIVLDEPASGLDPAGARELRALVRELARDGVAVLLSSHDMAEVEDLCDAVTILRRGRVVWDGPLERLRAEAPAPVMRLETSDDARALSLARKLPRVRIEPAPDRGLTVSAGGADLDRLVLHLAVAGIAVRRLEVEQTPLESMFFTLTEGPR